MPWVSKFCNIFKKENILPNFQEIFIFILTGKEVAIPNTISASITVLVKLITKYTFVKSNSQICRLALPDADIEFCYIYSFLIIL